ncbi:hypothetical protein F0365_05070 [Nonlabens sp. Ci31]|uniref:hypothetical protein n=1 Tax=Nonlabens sp. Ci31 TaxID=2608253 RepID=UPI001463768F|nr:hypothetical protein [Nonlabens sp. Ci31]QJP33820.1 hypothetical protein F0365_05070 [Nonlabens sp. Ci31]
MLTSFFKTSKPLHFIITFLMVGFLLGYFVVHDPYLGWRLIWIPFVAVGSIALFQLTTLKNNLTQNNSYSLWIHSCLLVIGALYSTSVEAFTAYLFFLLALRRLLSMRTGRGLVKKIFDASFWIALAAICYSWSSLLFLIIFISIILYAFNNMKYWTVPFIAASCVALLTFTYDQFIGTDYLLQMFERFDYNFDYLTNKWSLSTIVSLILGGAGFLFSMAILLGFPNISLSARSRFSILGFAGVCGSVFLVIDSIALFLLPVIAIFIARFIQETEDKVIKETLLWVPFIGMLILFFLRF